MDAFGVDHLDIQLEYNTARPFTWSSFDSLNSYTHYNQPLAHPLWANFNEVAGLIRYQPLPRWLLTGRLIYAQTGENTATENWGANPLLSNTSRMGDYGHSTGQGVGATIVLAGLDVSWELYHNLYLDLRLLLRTKDSTDNTRDLKTQLFSLGVRMNIWNPRLDF